ncbi:hypothetical protein DPMN_068569 [Dreissena polymorpha]|uniref:Uncharacterized protein n=1 Tax=Dreissena polymorpha TaxID=45954 RepID=A0A9D3YXV2_DREPO|nr:hypothetical protein DPMN_068569 [Dreissena polymorpha]
MARQRPTRAPQGNGNGAMHMNWCRNKEIIVKGNFGWAWPMWAGRPRVGNGAMHKVQYQFEVNRCRNEEIIVKGNFGWAWPMWAGRPRINRIVIRDQFEVNRCNFGWAWPMWACLGGRCTPGLVMGPCIAEIDSIVIREVQYQFEVNRCRNGEIIVKGNFGWAWPMWAGRPRVGNGAMHKVQYQFEDNQCRNEEIIFQGSSAYSVGGESGQDGQTEDGDNHNIPTFSPKSFAHLRGTNILVKSVNARVFTNQMWTNRQWTKTNSKTSPEQSAIFQLVREINKTNAKSETSIVFDHKENCPPPPGDIHKTNIFTKFHDDWAKNVTSRETNVLTKFHENWAKNVTSRVFTYINKTNVLTNFHDDWAKIVTSRGFTRKTAPPTGGHVFQRTRTTFELNQHIIKTNFLTKIHEDWACNLTSTVFELDRYFIGTKLLTKIHEDRTINVASRVFTNKCGWTDRRRTKTGHKSSPEQSGELKSQWQNASIQTAE